MKKASFLAILFILSCSFCTLLKGQNNKLIYNAYINADMQAWKAVMMSLPQNTNEQKLDLLNYEYGYIAHCIQTKKKKQAKKHLEKAMKLLAELEKLNYQKATLDAYKAALLAFKIGLAPYKGPFIGPESVAFAKKAIENAPDNYFGYLQMGNIDFYRPALFGGSKTRAITYYLKALRLIKQSPLKLKNNWNYINLLHAISKAYFEIKKYELAEEYCTKILAIAPNFTAVKNGLYQEIKKQH